MKLKQSVLIHPKKLINNIKKNNEEVSKNNEKNNGNDKSYKSNNFKMLQTVDRKVNGEDKVDGIPQKVHQTATTEI